MVLSTNSSFLGVEHQSHLAHIGEYIPKYISNVLMTCKNQYSFEPVEMEYRIFDFEKLNKIKIFTYLIFFLRPTMLLFKKRRRSLYGMEQNHKNR